MSIKKFFAFFWREGCSGCGKSPALNGYGFCASCESGICRIYNPEGNGIFHVVRYCGPAKEAICAMKYRRKKYYGKKFALMVSDFIVENGIDDFDALIPVPLHWKREFTRGFNQSALIAAGVAGILNKRCLQGILVKKKNTVSQTELDERGRAKNVRGTFAVKKTRLIEGKKILLLDDVYTSGATTKEARKVLLAAGAKEFTIVTVAKA